VDKWIKPAWKNCGKKEILLYPHKRTETAGSYQQGWKSRKNRCVRRLGGYAHLPHTIRRKVIKYIKTVSTDRSRRTLA